VTSFGGITGWQVVALGELAATITDLAGLRRPAVVAVSGHSSSGKTTLAGRLAPLLPHGQVLHTDDLAWHQGVFGWDELLIREVLPVVRSGRPLRYRPPAWIERGRPGQVELDGDLGFLVVEGVGASQRSVRDQLDVVIWVETEEPTRIARDVVRVAAGEISPASYLSWMGEENAHLITERPWESADLIVYGGEALAHDPEHEVMVAVSPA
jgi:energy-coupling factor transporter ATP-binding protein EcfA2